MTLEVSCSIQRVEPSLRNFRSVAYVVEPRSGLEKGAIIDIDCDAGVPGLSRDRLSVTPSSWHRLELLPCQGLRPILKPIR